MAASSLQLVSSLSPSSSPAKNRPNLQLRRTDAGRFRCSAGQAGFFTKLGRLIKEKARSDVEKIFSGFSKTRENLAVIDELLLYWNLAESERVLNELEEALLVSDFGPKISIKIVDRLRDDILAGKLKSGSEIKEALKRSVLELLTRKGKKTELQLGYKKPAVIMVVGVNGGGKTTSLGKLAHRLKNEGVKILMAAGDTFRAAASEQLEVWAERAGSEIVVAEGEKVKAPSVLSQAAKRGKEQGYDVVLCDTSGRLHTNYSLMEELISCKKAIAKVIPGAPNEILLVLDGTTGLNMLPQAREFNEGGKLGWRTTVRLTEFSSKGAYASAPAERPGKDTKACWKRWHGGVDGLMGELYMLEERPLVEWQRLDQTRINAMEGGLVVVPHRCIGKGLQWQRRTCLGIQILPLERPFCGPHSGVPTFHQKLSPISGWCSKAKKGWKSWITRSMGFPDD